MKDSTKIMIAAGAGLLAGAALGVLFAPASGKETRSKIAGKVDDLKEGIAEKTEQIKEKVSSVTQKAREMAEETKEAAQEAKAAMHKNGSVKEMA